MSYYLRALLTFLALISFSALAEANLQWRCWYDQQVHIACLLDEIPQEGAPFQAVSLPGNIPPIVARLRNDPATFRSQLVRIPLHTQPYDMAFTATLARASVCGSRRDCSVHFTAREPSRLEIETLLAKHAEHADRAPLIVSMMSSDDD